VAVKQVGRNYLYLVLGGLFAFALLLLLAYSIFPTEGCVGVIEVNGEIVSQGADATLFSDAVRGSDTISQEIEEAGSRPDVKSILLLVDSPGGGVVASREIYEALRAVNKSKVAYVNELAASGGYYAAVGTDYIVATPNALTGSIGSIITLSDMSGLFEKVGYNLTMVKSGEKKDMGSPARPLSDSERGVLQSIVNESFDEFRNAIVESRGSRLDSAAFALVTDGRLLSGRQAKTVGLVDELGNRKAAIMKAAELGGIASLEPRTCEISLKSERRGIFGSLASEIARIVLGTRSATPHLSYK
jgi:protease IV